MGALLALVVPAAAQAQVPHDYPSSSEGWYRADPDRPEAERARDEAEAARAEAACDAGDLTGCAALGRAYRDGTGRPQNRPVAELLFRQACNGGQAEGCFALGAQLRMVDNTGAQDEGMNALRRGCTLGASDACDALADIIAAENERAEELQSRINDCRAGELQSCDLLGGRYADKTEDLTPELRDAFNHGCTAGAAFACQTLGRAVFAEGRGLPEHRGEAQALFDRACANDRDFCTIAQQIRDRPALSASCANGGMADCAALGRIYVAEWSPLHSPAEGLRLLGIACEGGESEVCRDAAHMALIDPSPEAAARAEQWYAIGCNGGIEGDCVTLGLRLTDENRLSEDRARGYAVLVGACERGLPRLCDELYKRAGSDPEAPLLAADDRFGPPTEPTDPAEEARRVAESLAIEAENARFDPCRYSSVNFRGAVYLDTLCDPVHRVSRGYQLRPGQAPWQALLWRPAQMGGQNLAPGQRVACGGSLIAEGWVLTAAHCITDKDGKSLIGSGHRIRLGVYNPQAAEGVSYPILRTVAHPRYHQPSRAFDIALIRFDPRAGEKGAETNAIARIRIDPLPLEQREINAGMPVYTYGWGLTEFRGQSSDHLRGARMVLEDPEACTKRTEFRGSLLNAVLCAAAPDRSQACDGDSGGPLISYDDERRIPTVIGVVSAGEKCGSTGVPSRYTRVAKVSEWIADVMAGRMPARRR